MAENVKMTRKEKIAAGIPKEPKRKKAYAERLKSERQEVCKVELRNYRGSARKVRLVVDMIRGMEVSQAVRTLSLTPNRPSKDIVKLIRAGIASYEEKFEGERVDENTHYIREARVDGSRMLKRLLPAPQGRAHIIRKRFCHVTLVIDRLQEVSA